MAREIQIDLSEMDRMTRGLKLLDAQILPAATRNAINITAFDVRKRYQANMRSQLVLRNKFTVRSVRVDKAESFRIGRQEAIVGSVAPYAEKLEKGETRRKGGSEGVPIPTSYSAGQASRAKPRTRLTRKPNLMKNIQLNRGGSTGGSQKQRNRIKIRTATDKGANKFVYLDTGRRKGIYRVLPPKRRPNIKMVYDLTRPSVTSPKHDLLGEATRYGGTRVGKNMTKGIRQEISRRRAFKR